MTGQQQITTDAYRYALTRTDHALPWLAMHEPRLLWIMLNPSTADETRDDPTIRRVRAFTQRLGFSGFTVVNLYALRATSPADLWTADDPVGPDNNRVINEAAAAALTDGAPIIAAWGALAKPERVAEVLTLPCVHRGDLRCLGVTADGSPRHPLYLRSDAECVPWSAKERAA